MFQLPSLCYLLLLILFFSFTSSAFTDQKVLSNISPNISSDIKSKISPNNSLKKTNVKPKLQLATNYQKNIAIHNYWVSEKLDGVRGYWTGTQLLTRSGKVLLPPPWFINGWPNIEMDGELWSGRGQFEQISSCVRRSMTKKKTSNKLTTKPKQACWKKLKLMIFDLPHQAITFTERIPLMKQVITDTNSPYLEMIVQKKLINSENLYSLLDHVIAKDGEGLILHLTSAIYTKGRSKNLLKLKKHQDAEAVVIGHIPGKGKYKGLLGAIEVTTPEGITFKIGTGFTDRERQRPPKIGSLVTYKYIGKTQRGVPKFASFLRMKTIY